MGGQQSLMTDTTEDGIYSDNWKIMKEGGK